MKQACAALLGIMITALLNASGEPLRIQARGPVPPSAAQQRQAPRRYPYGVVPGSPTAAALDGFNNWIKEGDKTAIKWKAGFEAPSLLMSQKFSVKYSVATQVKHLKRLGVDREIVILFRADKIESAGTNRPAPAYGSIVVPTDAPPDKELFVSSTAVLVPGDYDVSLALYDGAEKTHNFTGRRIHLAVPNDPLPNLTFHSTTGKMILPVSNKNPLAVHLISVYRDPGLLELLTQMSLVNSSISVDVLNLEQRQVIFEQTDARQLDLRRLGQARVPKPSDPTIDLATLLEPQVRLKEEPTLQPGAYFQEFMRQKLESPSEVFRVFIVLSDWVKVPRGKDPAPLLQAGSDCRCRVIHLHQPNSISSNDVQKLLKPLQPRLFEFQTAQEFRKALAGIIGELESL